MRRPLVALVLLALVPGVAASEAYVVLLDWQHGRSLVGTTVLAPSPVADAFPFAVDACHRRLLLDLLYEPQNASATLPGVGSVALSYEFLVELRNESGRVALQRVRASGHGYPLGIVPAAGAHEVRVSLANGADVSWQVRVRGNEIAGELACLPRIVVNEVEANPDGPDAGNEWVELHNADASRTVDLGLWTLRATHGQPKEHVFPYGTFLAPGERLQVRFGAQFLDNVDEVVELVDAFGLLRDATPPLTDQADDERSWQRDGDGAAAWVFRAATPGSAN